jgi:hypothetical protein
MTNFNFSFEVYAKYAAPIIEEIFKSAYLIYLIKSKKTGFLVDSAILGFAVGAGFALVENIYYLANIETTGNTVWILRGLGTAIMHGGTTAIFAMVFYNVNQFYKLNILVKLSVALLLAIAIHWFFNQFFLSPKILILLQLILLPILFIAMFNSSEKKLHKWLSINLDAEMEILEHIHQGTLSETKVGQYIETIKDIFSMETIVDILCFIRIHHELSIRAKGALMMKKSGLNVKNDQNILDNLSELEFLRKSIGKAGMLVIAPILNEMSLFEWQKEFLKK